MPQPNITFDAIGTSWWIEAVGIDIPARQQTIRRKIESLESIWSRFRDNTLVSKMAKESGVYTLDASGMALMKWYEQLYKATDGLVTPLIGQTLVDAGYDEHYSLRPKPTIRQAPLWGDVISLQGDTMTIKIPTLIDVGAAGKGYIIDEVTKLITGNYCIDASGDIAVRGDSMRIGLEDPNDQTKLIGVATIKDKSICGSAVGRRAWGEWHHIVNPKTTKPTTEIAASWVVTEHAMHADGLATALFFVSPDMLSHLVPFEYCIVYADGTAKKSSGNTFELFTEGVK
jgi:thiamine biosynthesis lipoprotein